ncbi:hypothetical protein AJ80_09746 [Polytolypa hystricis UAMH7299]|uniref:Uncharacterized protein n=1 Tax=Polytolypa hystricis (strain UAMH7299) TaxID=1447883 RepID=A0A2B7WK02_POLH7|nr:hypothetical protein AJ80_09746 [Polytolypa hystricis UAMH7299]
MPSAVRPSRGDLLRSDESSRLPQLRAPLDDEAYVMWRYSQHTQHCMYCASPTVAFNKGLTLCERGHRHASKILKYIYSKGGKAFSVIDRECGIYIQIAIPRDLSVVNDLMRALDKGLQIHSPKSTSAPVVVHNPKDNTHHAESAFQDDDDSFEYPAPESVISESDHEYRGKKRVRHGERIIVSDRTEYRGSLHSSDASNRSKRRNSIPPVIIRSPSTYLH